jgi:hypothetical protein
MASNDLVVLQMVKALTDYDSLRVEEVLVAGAGFEIYVHDARLEGTYRIASHSDYWDFMASFAANGEWAVGRVVSYAAVRPA